MKHILWIRNLKSQDKNQPQNEPGGRRDAYPTMRVSKRVFLAVFCCCVGVEWTASRAVAASSGTGQPAEEVSTVAVVASGLRGGALVPTSTAVGPAHNREMMEAMRLWNAHRWAKGVERMERIWQESPDSPWAGEAELHEACYLKFNCRYDESEERFLSVLKKHPDSAALRKKVFYYLPHLYALTGRLADAVEAQKMLGEFTLNWQERQFLENQMRILSSVKMAQDDGRLCGTKALALAVAAAERGQPEEGLRDVSYKDIFGKRPWALERSSHPDGYSIAELARLGGGTARRVSYEELRQLAKPGRPVIAYLDVPRAPKVYATLGRPEPANRPSLTGHFIVVERVEQSYLEALDPIKGRERWDARMFQARSSGIVLLLPGVTGEHGQPLENGLAETLRGGCCGSTLPDPCAGDDSECCGGASSGPGSGFGWCPGCGGPVSGAGAPSYRFNLPSANLIVVDTPMWYPAANGPEMNIHLVYSRINSGILSGTNTPPANYYIFGNKWSFNYNSFVKETPSTNTQVVMSSGRVLEYYPDFTAVDIRNRHTLTVEGEYYRLTLDGSRTSYYYSTNTDSQAGQQVERIVDRFGQTITMQYNASGQLTNITDAIGRFFNLAYNGDGYVTNVTDVIGRSCSFGYSTNGNLTSMTDVGGYTTTLQYDTNNWVTSVVYPNNSTLRMTYENGRQIGGVEYAGFDQPFRMRVIDSLNHTNEYMYHAFSGGSGPATVRDASGNTWLYGHDSWQGGNTTPAIRCEGVNDQSFGRGTEATEGVADQLVYRGMYSDTHFVANESQPVSAGHGPEGPYTNDLFRTFAYTHTNWMTSETWFTNGLVVAVWSNDYDNAGNRTYTREPLGAETHTVYTANDLPISITNALQQVTNMEYDDHGNLTRSVNPRSAETKWAYDGRGLCTNLTLPDSTTQRMTYDSVGRLLTVTDPAGLTVSNQYGNLDRVTDVWYPDQTYTHYNFSCCGLNSVVDRLGRQTTYQRDILGRVTDVIDAANQRVGFSYGAGGEVTNLTVWMDGAPRTTHFGYTSTNGYTRLTQRTSPLGKTTGYDYYFRGWLKTRTDGANRVTQYQYDVLGRLNEINYPGGTNVTMSYDAVGHVTSLANNNGSSTFAYDILGRLTNTTVSLSVPGMTNVQYALEYRFDAAGNVTNRTLRTGIGGSGSTQTVTTRYEYDAMNRLALVTNALAWASYQYADGRLTSKVYSNGDTVSYGYDLESRLTNLAIQAGGQTLQGYAYTYNAMGMIESVSTGQLTVAYGYDGVYQLNSEVVNVSGTVTTNTWRYDAAGNLRGTTQGARQTVLTVNGDNELTTSGDVTNQGVAAVEQVDVAGQVEPGPNSNKWYASTATAHGQNAPVSPQHGGFVVTNVPVMAGANVLTATVQDVSGNVATQVVNFTVQTVTNRSQFVYDANGNMSSAGVSPAVVYQYDAENRLTSVTSNGVTVLQCWYDGDGHRIAKREIIGGQTNAVQYVWNRWELVAVLGEDGQLKEYYTRGKGIARDIGSLVAVTQYGAPSATYYLHNNHRGDVIMTRQGTTTVATLDYAPYGELRSQSGSYTPRFCFSSKEYDASTGFYHFPYRYYAPQWARWITRDPLDIPSMMNMRKGIRSIMGAMNLYSYVANQPLTSVDPDGQGRWGDFWHGFWDWLRFMWGLIIDEISCNPIPTDAIDPEAHSNMCVAVRCQRARIPIMTAPGLGADEP
jgi:RHS repeat-associated protein